MLHLCETNVFKLLYKVFFTTGFSLIADGFAKLRKIISWQKVRKPLFLTEKWRISLPIVFFFRVVAWALRISPWFLLNWSKSYWFLCYFLKKTLSSKPIPKYHHSTVAQIILDFRFDGTTRKIQNPKKEQNKKLKKTWQRRQDISHRAK